MKKIITLLVALIATSISLIYAAVPYQFNYQGRLTNHDGSPVTDGQYSVTFTIYDAAEAGNMEWTGVNEVNTKQGYYSTIIGSGIQDLSSVDFSKSLYLAIKVTPDAEMAPRHFLVSVPYALYAQEASLADLATSATTATSATSATNATSATSATEATNALNLGGRVASGYLTTENSSVKTNHITNGAVTAAKAPWAPIVYVNGAAQNNPKIMTGSVNSNGSGTASVTFPTGADAFTQNPFVTCALVGSGSVTLNNAPTTSGFTVTTVPVSTKVNWIAVGY